MKREYLVESVAGQTRLAVIEDGALCELYYERPGSEKLAGNLYLGRVQNILPGMNAAFVDVGLGKNAFLHAGDIPGDAPSNGEDPAREPRIDRLLHIGQEILVQVVKEPGGAKGCRVTGYASLPGRLSVALPQSQYRGVSRKIEDAAERERLYDIATRLSEESGLGIILRTASEGMSEERLRSDYEVACKLWREVENRAKHMKAPGLAHSDGNLALRLARDRIDDSVDAVWVDDPRMLEEIRRYIRTLAPRMESRIHGYEGETPLFDNYRVDHQAEKRMARYVWLKSGGSLVIDETEAMTVIDVNTGKFVGNRSFEETVFRLNCEAAREIARLIRLRDIGGIIVIDFIDMTGPERREELLALMRELMTADCNRTNVLGFTGLGLMEMTRKRSRRSLTKQLMHVCPNCDGFGWTPSYETTARKIVRELWIRERKGFTGELLAEASEPVAGWLASIGAPGEMRVYVAPADLPDAEYRISPADARALPPGSKLLKRGM